MGIGLGVDFHINVRPYSIDFYCPYCQSHIEVLWNDVDEPDYWGEPWGVVECPECGEYVLLGDWKYD